MSNDSQLCFDMANAFYDVGRLANEYDAKVQKAPFLLKSDAYYAFPAIVNLSFACELYIKALLSKSGHTSIIRSHSLDKLFHLLPESIQGQMEEGFARQCHYPVTLQKTLETHSKAFEEWRYAFEEDKKSIEAYPDNLQLATEIIRDAFFNAN